MNIGKEITMNEYQEKFEILDKNSRAGIEKIQAAYNKAWECRNFEIDKFWSRAAFFWAFIALAFGGYGYLLSQHPNADAKDIPLLYVRLELLCILGGAFLCFIWWQSIRASKIWQENWEAHIELLEDHICGPLYKTVIVEKEYFPSVSKLAECVAIGVLVTWIFIFVIHTYQYWIKEIHLDWIQLLMGIVFIFSIIILIIKILINKKTSMKKYIIEILPSEYRQQKYCPYEVIISFNRVSKQFLYKDGIGNGFILFYFYAYTIFLTIRGTANGKASPPNQTHYPI